ncbi:MAG: hypothetical protein WCG23_00175 [bacterium]
MATKKDFQKKKQNKVNETLKNYQEFIKNLTVEVDKGKIRKGNTMDVRKHTLNIDTKVAAPRLAILGPEAYTGERYVELDSKKEYFFQYMSTEILPIPTAGLKLIFMESEKEYHIEPIFNSLQTLDKMDIKWAAWGEAEEITGIYSLYIIYSGDVRVLKRALHEEIFQNEDLKKFYPEILFQNEERED